MQAGYGPIAVSAAKAAVLHRLRVAAAQLSPRNVRTSGRLKSHVASAASLKRPFHARVRTGLLT